jgi:Ribosomal RNA-processing protein 7 (RRP7) C-terminal domain
VSLGWLDEYLSTYHTPEMLRKRSDLYMQKFDQQQERDREAREAQVGKPDDDGFILVQRSGRKAIADAKGKTHIHAARKPVTTAEAKKREAEKLLTDFYGFQKRESRRKRMGLVLACQSLPSPVTRSCTIAVPRVCLFSLLFRFLWFAGWLVRHTCPLLVLLCSRPPTHYDFPHSPQHHAALSTSTRAQRSTCCAASLRRTSVVSHDARRRIVCSAREGASSNSNRIN